MRLLPVLAAAVAAAALAAPTALATSGPIDVAEGPPGTTSTTDCAQYPGGIACVPEFPEDDLPQPITEPEVPAGPGDGPSIGEPNAVCTAKVLVNGATGLSQLANLKACPGTRGFNDGKLAVLRGPAGGPKCDRAGDVIRLRYTIVSGGTTLRPEIGECVRGGALLFSLALA